MANLSILIVLLLIVLANYLPATACIADVILQVKVFACLLNFFG